VSDPDEQAVRADIEKVLADVREAIATGREPEDVQAERHARERYRLERELARRRWWRSFQWWRS
jgi:siroheme synthase (precorrin-2 oxidase/ferrochelatase)